MKYFLLTNFQDNIQFTIVHGIQGNPIIVHSVDVNPVVYTMVSIIGAELRHKYMALAFAKMINYKQNPQKLLKTLMKELDKCDPIK